MIHDFLLTHSEIFGFYIMLYTKLFHFYFLILLDKLKYIFLIDIILIINGKDT